MSVTASARSGKRRAIISTTIAATGTDVAHRGTRAPVAVEWVPIGTSSSGAVLTYSPTESTSVNARLYSSVNLQEYRLTFIWGTT